MDLFVQQSQLMPLISALIAQFGGVFNRDEASIKIPKEIQGAIYKILPYYEGPFEEPSSLPELITKHAITDLVTALKGGIDTWCRLDSHAFAILGRLLLAAETCLAKEQGLFKLMNLLDKPAMRSDFQSYKAAIGQYLLLPLYWAFIDSSRPSRPRRWSAV
ncbi:hypothetical protein BDZ91DRAFT_27466 [Kalaharituber pfeilii]|nr:hypothetical protein BDZ91DRAFT_27466 [Kalaharituber pfeilii]